MSEPDPWATLGVACTDDARAIKRAYAARLRAIDVDVDILGFQRLRQSYEWALGRAGSRAPARSGGNGDAPQPVDRSSAAARIPLDEHAPGDVALRMLTDLSALAPDDQLRWLESDPTLASLALRERVEIEVLDLLVDEYSRWEASADAVLSYFHWEQPLRARNDREFLLQQLYERREQSAVAHLAVRLLSQLCAIPTLVGRLRWLQDEASPARGRRDERLEMELLRELAARPVELAKCAWSLVVWFRWELPESADSDYSRLLLALLDPEGPCWARLRDAAVADLLAELRTHAGLTDQRRFLASDRRLEDLRWRPHFEAELRSHYARHPGAAEARALAVHFGWADSRVSAVPASAGGREKRSMGWSTALVVASLLALMAYWALRSLALMLE